MIKSTYVSKAYPQLHHPLSYDKADLRDQDKRNFSGISNGHHDQCFKHSSKAAAFYFHPASDNTNFWVIYIYPERNYFLLGGQNRQRF